MTSLRAKSALCAALSVAACSPGCTILTAVEGYDEIGPRLTCGMDGDQIDFVLMLSTFSAHTRHVLRGDVIRVEGATRTRVGRFVLEPGAVPDATITMPCLLDAGDVYQLDLVADVPDASGVANGVVDCPPGDPPNPLCTDHQWRLDIPASGVLAYPHAFDFRDISVNPGDTTGMRELDVTLINVEAFEGEPLEVHVRRCEGATCAEGLRRTIYVHRLGEIPVGSDLTLPRMSTIAFGLPLAQAGLHETVFWIDTNHDGQYQPPADEMTPRDVSWRLEDPTDVDGLHPTLDVTGPGAVFTDVEIYTARR